LSIANFQLPIEPAIVTKVQSAIGN
jgi:hypothetical protein